MKFSFIEETEEGEIIKVDYRLNPGERVGITGTATYKGETTETASKQLFYTEEEAICWCRFLVENKVLPSSLNQILSDELYTY